MSSKVCKFFPVKLDVCKCFLRVVQPGNAYTALLDMYFIRLLPQTDHVIGFRCFTELGHDIFKERRFFEPWTVSGINPAEHLFQNINTNLLRIIRLTDIQDLFFCPFQFVRPFFCFFPALLLFFLRFRVTVDRKVGNGFKWKVLSLSDQPVDLFTDLLPVPVCFVHGIPFGPEQVEAVPASFERQKRFRGFCPDLIFSIDFMEIFFPVLFLRVIRGEGKYIPFLRILCHFKKYALSKFLCDLSRLYIRQRKRNRLSGSLFHVLFTLCFCYLF